MPSRSFLVVAALFSCVSCRAVNPEAPCEPTAEVCNGLDDNCDERVDEGCACSVGESQPCYSGSSATRDVGACRSGSQTCSAGAWSACTGEVIPTSERCNGLDDDCNGVVDDQVADAGVSCATNLPGQCASGQTTCSSAAFSCLPVTPASDEACDGVDNDCDGIVDNGNPDGGALCNTGLQGACARGTTTCTAGAITCAHSTMPTNEVCDSIDNDCDGTVDDVSAVPIDNVPESCATAPTRVLHDGDSVTGYIELGGADWFYVELSWADSFKAEITQNAAHYRLETFVNCSTNNPPLCQPATRFESTCVDGIHCTASCGQTYSRWSHFGIRVVRISGTRCTPYTVTITN